MFPARQVFKEAAKADLLGIQYETQYGGLAADHSFQMVVAEEYGRSHSAGPALALGVQCMMATPSLALLGTHEQKEEFLAPAIAGDAVTAIGVSEPGMGSDVATLSTRARRDGDDWVINGRKMWITNGSQADWICLLARTGDEGGYRGMTQIIVPTDSPGFGVAKVLDKLGHRSSDTTELIFDDVRVPVRNSIGEIGRGFQQQMIQFVVERLYASYCAVGSCDHALERTRTYLSERELFGSTLASKQYVAFRMAELQAQVDLLRHHNYATCEALMAGDNIVREASVAKLTAGRLSREVADMAVQFHGGMGYVEEFWPARAFRDARLASIGGGADEVMLQILAKLDGLGE